MRASKAGSVATATAAIVICLAVRVAVSLAQPVQPVLDNVPQSLHPNRQASEYRLPIIFEPNVGQADPHVKFLSRARDAVLFLASDEAILSMSSPSVAPLRAARGGRAELSQQSSSILTMKLLGANPDATLEGRGKALARINYFVGKDRSRWHTNIPTVNEVVAHEAWPNIDVSYRRDRNAGPEAVECTFIVRAGANPSAIRLAFDAPGDVNLRPDGNVETALGVRKIRFTRPRVFEEGIDGRHEVAAKFVALASDRRTTGRQLRGHQLTVRFEVARRDPGARLVIDPSLVYSSYLGGSGEPGASGIANGTGDSVNAIALDKDGNEYLTGATTSLDFPSTNDSHLTGCPHGQACNPAFVTKLDGKTGAIIYSTFLGGGGGSGAGLGNGDEGLGIAIDQFGNAYVAGATFSRSFPTTAGALFENCDFCQPVPFVTKLSADGSSLLYSTLLSKNGTGEFANAIAIDESGNAYVAGDLTGVAMALVLNPAGTALTYAVALASSRAYAVAVTANHRMLIGGQAYNQDFPSTTNAFQRRCGKCSKHRAGFVALLDPSKGSTRASLRYSTYLGGSAAGDIIRAIAVDGKGRAWVAGSASPTSMPGGKFEVKKCAKGAVCGNDALLAIIDPAKAGRASLAFSEFIGGNGADSADAIALDGSGNAYLGGHTTSTNFPVTNNAVQPSYTPCTGCERFRGAGFVAVLNPSSKKSGLHYATYLGGATVLSPPTANGGNSNLTEVDAVRGIAVDSNGRVHAAGLTYAGGFPITGSALEKVCKACATLGSDGFVARINPLASTGATALEYSSFFGGGGPRFFGDSASAVAMDSSGAVYVAGMTNSPDFPVTSGAVQQNCRGCVTYNFGGFVSAGSGAFVAKLDPTAAPDSQLIYATYLDGGGTAWATGIAVDSAGEAYVSGESFSADFPITPSAYTSTCLDCVFFAKLDATGSQLLYSSFLGTGIPAGVAIDLQNNALIAGLTVSPTFPTTAGAIQSSCAHCNQTSGGFFSRMDPTASGAASLKYSTYLSGSGGTIGASATGDVISAITVDGAGNAILTGQATSPDFPVTANAFQQQCSEPGFCESPVVSVINPALSGSAALLYSTYLNGPATISNAIAFPYAVAVDLNNNIYIGGNTTGYDFPVSPNTFLPKCPGFTCSAGFIVELNPNAPPASQIVYGTYLGGTSSYGVEAVTGLGVDSNGRIFATGHTLSPNFPVTPDAAQLTCLSCVGPLQGINGRDGFLAVLNPAASGASQLVYSTFLGGTYFDAPTALAMGPNGLVAVAGYSSSSDFPTTANALQLECPACRNVTGNVAPSYLNEDAFVSVFQF